MVAQRAAAALRTRPLPQPTTSELESFFFLCQYALTCADGSDKSYEMFTYHPDVYRDLITAFFDEDRCCGVRCSNNNPVTAMDAHETVGKSAYITIELMLPVSVLQRECLAHSSQADQLVLC